MGAAHVQEEFLGSFFSSMERYIINKVPAEASVIQSALHYSNEVGPLFFFRIPVVALVLYLKQIMLYKCISSVCIRAHIASNQLQTDR